MASYSNSARGRPSAGASVLEVADQAGHSAEECLRSYAHQFARVELESSPGDVAGGWVAAAEAIRQARGRFPECPAVEEMPPNDAEWL